MPQAHQLSTALTQAADTIEMQVPVTRAYLVQNGIDGHFADVLLSHYLDVAVAARAAVKGHSGVGPFAPDTSGVVKVPTGKDGISHHYLWADFPLLVQGYAEAALQSVPDIYLGAPDKYHRDDYPSFTDFASEAITMIQRDCAALAEYGWKDGAEAWAMRQTGDSELFPARRIYLNDAGKIVFGTAPRHV